MMSLGLVLAFLSGCVVATSSLVVKLASGHATVLQATLFRNVIMISVLCVFLTMSGEMGSLFRTPRRTMAWMLVRSVASFLALASVYALNSLIPLGDAAAIAGSAPIFTGLFGFLILKEAWTILHILSAIVCWLGVVLVVYTSGNPAEANESTSTSLYLTTILSTAVPLSIALSLVLSRKLAQRRSVYHNIVVTSFGIICCSLVAMSLTEGVHLPSAATWKYLICAGIGGLLSQFLMTKALSMESAASCALMRNSRVVVGFMFQILIYNQHPTLQSLTGAGIVIATTAVVSILKSNKKSPEKSN
ncbi:solute carrier family 35 member G1-like [Amphiura filiformis]|uniref:solute carrier family 35 member G1-like n=1 Tax=Amphiura filiformis TaxID=82378 RepID=UPI003B21FD6D